MKILLIEPGLEPRPMEITHTLDAMQALVGGRIQILYPFPEQVALVCHDEGKLLDLPLNRSLRHPETDEVYDVIAGTFFLCSAPKDSESLQSLSEDQITRYSQLFHDPELFLKGGEQV